MRTPAIEPILSLTAWMLPLALLACVCADDGQDVAAPPSATPMPHPACEPGTGTVSVRGNLFEFGPSAEPRNGGTISAVDGTSATTSLHDSAWELGGIAPCTEQVFRLQHPDVLDVQTGILFVPAEGLEQVSFQSTNNGLYKFFVGLLGVEVDPAACIIASTVTRKGASLYTADISHGEPGAVVAIEPAVDPALGPVYFHYHDENLVLPDRELTETTEDGGVLYVNVPPGTYVLSATKPGVEFDRVWVRCDAGTFVNASPPYGIQAR